MLDHILVTPSLRVNRLEVIDFACSDHLPVAMEVALPDALAQIGRSARPPSAFLVGALRESLEP